MAVIAKKVSERLVAGIKKYAVILDAAKARDVGEADTVTIIKDMLAEVFGYDKYSDLTSEFIIKGTFCDLAIRVDNAVRFLIEVKAIGVDLKDPHVKQVVDYAANKGVDWVLLTNGVVWRLYKVTFAKPIDHELVLELDFCKLNPKNLGDIDKVYLWCKEGWAKSVLGEFHQQKQALSRFFIGAAIQTEPVLDAIRKELRKVSPDVRIENELIRNVLVNEVIKREVMEGEKAAEALKKLTKSAAKVAKPKAPSTAASAPRTSAADDVSSNVDDTVEDNASIPQPA